MITKQEIMDLAREFSLEPKTIEKDYVLGWLLAGISNNSELMNKWVFKGGTCLKKCYFETYRFSEDLDYTLTDEKHIDEKFLIDNFKQIATWIYDAVGIEIPEDKIRFDIYENKAGKVSIEGSIYYIGPLQRRGSIARIKLASKKHPDRVISTWHEHCANNPSHKDELSYAEMQYITETYFENLPGPPAAEVLTEFHDADKFDQQIRGWVRYWNDIFNSSDPLNANLIKALIATESSFHPNPTRVKTTHGLMQITNLTFRVLQDTKGELKDYLIRMTQDELLDPSTNICAGVRWLFWKKITASARLKRTATWEEAIIEYKGYWDEVNQGHTPKPLEHLREYFKRLEESKNFLA